MWELWNTLKNMTLNSIFIHLIRSLRAANLYMKIFQGDEPIKIPDIDRYIDMLDSPIEIEGFRIFFIESPAILTGAYVLKLEMHCLQAIRC